MYLKADYLYTENILNILSCFSIQFLTILVVLLIIAPRIIISVAKGITFNQYFGPSGLGMVTVNR